MIFLGAVVAVWPAAAGFGAAPKSPSAEMNAVPAAVNAAAPTARLDYLCLFERSWSVIAATTVFGVVPVLVVVALVSARRCRGER